MLNLHFVSSVSFSDSWRYHFDCLPKWNDHLDGQRYGDTDLQWPCGNSGRQHTGTLTSRVLYWNVLQSYQGKAIHRYADFSGVILGRSSVIPGEGNTQVR